jgi:hypothetical protein
MGKITFTLCLPWLVLGVFGCGVNPVTGKNELQLVSESQEIQIRRRVLLLLSPSGREKYVADRIDQMS